MTSFLQHELPSTTSNIGGIVGPRLIGVILDWFLYGILVMQIYVYYQWFPSDKKMIKCLVYGLFFFDTLQSVLMTYDAFHWFTTVFGNITKLSKPLISSFDVPILDGIVAFVVQSFFCWRIKILQKSWWLPLIILCISLTSLVGALALGVKTFQAGDLSKFGDLKWEFSLWLGGSALADTMIAIVMTYVLLHLRSKNCQQTNNILVKIVRLTVETNTVTASIAIVALVVLLAIPKYPNITMTPGFALGKSYSNTLLAILNNRVYMKRRLPSTMSFCHTTQLETSEASNEQVDTRPGESYCLDISVHNNMDAKVLPV